MRGNLGKILIFLLIGAMALPMLPNFSGCNKNSPNTVTNVNSQPEVKVEIPSFSKDSAFTFIENQVKFGPRVPNTSAHRACRAWLVSKLKSYGAMVEEQELAEKAYDGTTLKGANIIAKFNPQNPRRVLLAAHWDTRHIADKDKNAAMAKKSFDGADDGASGVGILLEIARAIKSKPTDLGVDIILFDLEDYGKSSEAESDEATWCLGSQYWAKNKGSYQARFGILLDMVGSKGATFLYEGYSNAVAPEVLKKVWNIGKGLGHERFFIAQEGGAITDDHFYVNRQGIPMIDIINLKPGGGFGDYHHTQNDNMTVIDKETLHAVLETVLTAVYKEAAGVF